MKAFEKCSVDEVQQVLKNDPEAAERVFFDHEFQPPLVSAICNGCGVAVARLLLQFRAPVNASDIYGRPALSYIVPAHPTPHVRQQMNFAGDFFTMSGVGPEPSVFTVPSFWCLDDARAHCVLPPEPRPCLSPDVFELAALLLEAGANPHLQDHRGQTPVSRARQEGQESLACFLENYASVHAFAVLRGQRAVAKGEQGTADSNVDTNTGAERGVQGLSDELLRSCCSFLAP
jgi:hypothetical protein